MQIWFISSSADKAVSEKHLKKLPDKEASENVFFMLKVKIKKIQQSCLVKYLLKKSLITKVKIPKELHQMKLLQSFHNKKRQLQESNSSVTNVILLVYLTRD